MDKSIIFNLIKAACLLTLIGFFIDRHEFQGDYGVAVFEFMMMTSIISVFFLLVYLAILNVSNRILRR